MDLSKSYDFFQPDKHDCRIHIIGCGSVGSTVAVMLARAGVTKMTLWDFDIVESKNLANQQFRSVDIGKSKIEALADMMEEINPDIRANLRFQPEGWNGQLLSGFVFLCVDNIEIRKAIVEQHFDSENIRAMFDFRTGLEDAQHYAADWSNLKMRTDFLNSMNFTHDEAKEETPMSACNVTLSVYPTVAVVCALGVANFMNFWNDKPIRKLVLANAYQFGLDAF